MDLNFQNFHNCGKSGHITSWLCDELSEEDESEAPEDDEDEDKWLRSVLKAAVVLISLHVEDTFELRLEGTSRSWEDSTLVLNFVRPRLNWADAFV